MIISAKKIPDDIQLDASRYASRAPSCHSADWRLDGRSAGGYDKRIGCGSATAPAHTGVDV